MSEPVTVSAGNLIGFANGMPEFANRPVFMDPIGDARTHRSGRIGEDLHPSITSTPDSLDGWRAATRTSPTPQLIRLIDIFYGMNAVSAGELSLDRVADHADGHSASVTDALSRKMWWAKNERKAEPWDCYERDGQNGRKRLFSDGSTRSDTPSHILEGLLQSPASSLSEKDFGSVGVEEVSHASWL
jgi:hypothetical protein